MTNWIRINRADAELILAQKSYVNGNMCDVYHHISNARYQLFSSRKSEEDPCDMCNCGCRKVESRAEPAELAPGDECECDGCRAKGAEEVKPESANVDEEYAELEQLVRDGIKAMDERSDFGCLRLDPIINDQPSDYEIRLKAWNIAYDFAWEDVDNEFSATLDAATKLYNFLSGQNEDVK